MSAIKKTAKPSLKRAGRNNEILVVEPSKRLFKVVVNNYKQAIESLDKIDEEPVETIIDEHQGLPPQPSGYIKYPTYDWF